MAEEVGQSWQEALEAARPRMEPLAMYYAAMLDQIATARRHIAPAMRAWVADCDRLTDQQWLEMPASTRELYEQLCAALAEIDDTEQ
jgi:hypothetical protein